MSKSSKNKSKNFEQLYYSLKEEYDQMQKDNNDIYKEYESTIQMLTDSINELQNQRNTMTKKLSQIEKEKESLQNKNRDKIIDIQDLNKKNEKLNQEIKKIKEDKKVKDTKIVILENDTDHFQKLIRQNEAVIDELSIKLEEALEENITMQTEFEIYKQIMGEKLMRKEEEIKEIKNDMYSKNLMIRRLKNEKDEKSPIKNRFLQLKFNEEKSTYKKNKNKTQSKINLPCTYSRDNNFSISLEKQNELFKNIIFNSFLKNEIKQCCQTNIKKGGHIVISSIKKNPKKYRIKFLHSNTEKKFDKNKLNSLKTPSNNKNKKITNSNANYYNHYDFKKNYDNINEYKQINKFEIGNVHDDTTADLSVFKNEDNTVNINNIDNDICSNLLSKGKKMSDEELIICDKNIIDIAPFKDMFLKKLLYSKKLCNNMKKLIDINHRNKGKKVNHTKKWDSKGFKIGYMIK